MNNAQYCVTVGQVIDNHGTALTGHRVRLYPNVYAAFFPDAVNMFGTAITSAGDVFFGKVFL